MHNGDTALVVSLDLKKAFDTVDHDILLEKLRIFGFSDSAYDLFSSYLSCRKQYVSLDNCKSTLSTSNIGIPQGSVLGPILFPLYTNDFPSILACSEAISYADDTAIIFIGKTTAHAEALANAELGRISYWAKGNKLTINGTKTKYMGFQSKLIFSTDRSPKIFLDNCELEQVDYFKSLGVTLDTQLNWKAHIESICSKLASICFILLRIRTYFNCTLLKQIYFTLFHCHLTYCCESWAFTFRTHLEPLVRLQKRAIRTITFSPWCGPSAPLFHDLQILPLALTAEMKVALIINKLLHNNLLP